MANTFCSLNIHCIFSTKERVPMLNPELREWLWPFLGGIAKQNGITPRCIGGVAHHVHLLLSLPTTVPIAKAIQLIKAGSSAWIQQTFRFCSRCELLGTALGGISRVEPLAS
jgi:putative transposase